MTGRMFNMLPIYFHKDHKSDWTFVDNLIFACFLACEKIEDEKVGENVFNITDGQPTGYLEFFQPLLEARCSCLSSILYTILYDLPGWSIQ